MFRCDGVFNAWILTWSPLWLQFYSLIGEMGFNFGEVAEVLPRVADQFSPLFVGDHVVAL